MRLLRLDLGQGQLAVDLHPFVTIVRLLDEAGRASVLDAVRRLARGSTAGTRGLVEHEGILVELDGRGDDRLSMVTSVDVVIDADGDPSLTLSPIALQAQIDQQERRAEIDAVMVEEVRADIDPAARFRLAAIEAQMAPVDEETFARRAAERAQIEEILTSVASLDPIIREAPPGVAELRDQWLRHSQRVAESAAHLDQLISAIEVAERTLVTAEHELADAAEAATAVLLTRDEEARLEMLSFPGMDESRKGRWRKNLRPEEEEEKQALLDKVGLESWTAYNMYRMDPTPPQAKVDAEITARRNRDAAQAELDRASVALASDPVHDELNREIDQIKEEARHHLGPVLPLDLGEALGELVIERDNPDYLAAVRRLDQELDHLVGPVKASPIPNGSNSAINTLARADGWLRAARSEKGPDLEALGRARREAELDVIRHDRALARIDRVEAAAVASSLELVRLEQLLRSATEGDASSESILARLEPLIARIRAEADGSLPVVVVDPFDDLDDEQAQALLDGLASLAQQLQIIVIADNEVAVRWAALVGLDTAMVSRPKPLTDSTTTPVRHLGH